MALMPGWRSAVAGAIITNFAAGMILPTLITWAISALRDEHMGTGTGLWISASFLGQFLSPLLVLALKQLTGSLSGAIAAFALACTIVAAVTLTACATSVTRWRRDP